MRKDRGSAYRAPKAERRPRVAGLDGQPFSNVSLGSNDRARRSQRARPGPLPSILLICGILSAWLVNAERIERPGIFLHGATVARAKGLALDAALVKGWQVARIGPNYVVFETILEEPASPGPPNAVMPDQTLLRIRADFVETPAGVNTYLQGEEVWYAGSPNEWSADVTAEYRTNLSNALSSLRTQWTRVAKTRTSNAPSGSTAAAPNQTVRVTPGPEAGNPADTSPRVRRLARPLPQAPPPALPPPPGPLPEQRIDIDVKVGTWAYYAEDFAVRRGCILGEIGAELISGDNASELHRVHCNGGSSVYVRCDREGCLGAR